MWQCRAILVVPAAQDYPTRPITLVVPYSAGGGNDVMARVVADKMSKTLGQQIVIENRGGAGGTIATRQIAKAAPDGYTLGLGGTGTLAINPTLYANVGYDPRKDFAPVGLIATSALVVCVHPVAAGALDPGADRARQEGAGQAELCVGRDRQRHPSRPRIVRDARRHPADACSLQGQRAGAHRSVGGHVRCTFTSLPPAVAHAGGQGAGARRDRAALAACSPTCRPWRKRRCPATRPCCTTASWRRPARRPRSSTSSTPHCARRSPSDELRARLADAGAEPLPTTPEEYAADIDREETKWSAIVTPSGAKAD